MEFTEITIFGLQFIEFAMIIIVGLPLIGLTVVWHMPLHRASYRDGKWLLLERDDHLAISYNKSASFETEEELKAVLRSCTAATENAAEYSNS